MRVEWSDNWEAEFDAARRRRFLALLSASFVMHLGAATTLVLVPRASRPALPPVISIRLVSLPGQPGAKARPAPVSKPKPLPPKKILLPKKAPALREKPRKVKPLLQRPRPKELEYAEALERLRSELGEAAPEAMGPEGGEAAERETMELEASAAAGGRGVPVSKELLAWQLATRRHVQSRYITPQEFLNRSLETELAVDLAASGEVLGEPRVTRSSGDPFWDDNAVRTVMKASPLPPPPEAGTWVFAFPSEDR